MSKDHKVVSEAFRIDTKVRKRWTKEENAVILKEIPIRNTNPEIRDKYIKQKLSILFNNVKRAESFAFQRKTRWNEKVKSQIVDFASNDENDLENTLKTNANVDDKDFETDYYTRDINSKVMKSDYNHQEPNKSIFDSNMRLLNEPQEDKLMEIGNFLRYQERNVNFFENGAKSISYILFF